MDGIEVAAGLAALRAALGTVYVVHGLRKLGVGSPRGFAGFRDSIARRGYRPAVFWAGMAVFAEIVGGVLLVLGLLVPLGAALLVGQSVTILLLVRHKGFWHDEGGIEYPLVLTAASLAVAGAGPGAWSVDAVLGLQFGLLGPVLAILAAVGAVAGLAARRQAPTPA